MKIKISKGFIEILNNHIPIMSLCLSLDIFRLRIYDNKGHVLYTLTLWYKSCNRDSWQLYKRHNLILQFKKGV